MLKNVKSSYFIKIIFSFIYEKQKLKLIKYNKSLQDNMNISLINYKFLVENIYYMNKLEKEKNMIIMVN